MHFKFAMTPINTNQLFRAIAILLVVANHSVWFSLAGGMNFLLLLSGYNFASFSLTKPNKAIIVDLWQLIRKIALPSMIIMGCYFIINQQFKLEELLMISNWYYLNKVTTIALPIWYPQLLIQMGAILTILFMFIPMHKLIAQHKIKTTMTLVLFSLVIFVIATSNYDTLHLKNRLPHLMLWNFILGWALWALLNTRTLQNQLIASLLLLLCVYIVYVSNQVQGNRLAIFLSLALAFIWVKQVYLPSLMVTVINIISSATLFLFLLHLSFFQLYHYITSALTISYRVEVLSKFTFSVAGCILTWLIITAANSARIKLRNHQIK